MRRRLSTVVVLAVGLAAACHGDTFYIVVQELRDGAPVTPPSAGQQGIMAAMFDLGYVSFDSGRDQPAVDWDRGSFSGPLQIAVEGRADYLLAARVASEVTPLPRGQRQGGAAPAAAPAAEAPQEGQSPLRVTTEAHYYLLDVPSGRQLAEGVLATGSPPDDPDLTYEKQLFRVGGQIVGEVVRKWQGTAVQP
jgi:hypothetical protein